MQKEYYATPQTHVAVVGVGYWGKNLVRNFSQLGVLSALCDANQALEQSVQEAYADVRFCRNYQEVLLDPAIRAVALATPAVTHYEMVRAALEAGKDVFVEKPLAIEVRQGEELVKLAAEQGSHSHGGSHSQVPSGGREIDRVDPRGPSGKNQLPVFEPSEHREDSNGREYSLEFCPA